MEHLWVTQHDHLARCCCRTAGRHADAARPATYKELRLGHMIGEGACIPAQDGRRAAKVSLVWQQPSLPPTDSSSRGEVVVTSEVSTTHTRGHLIQYTPMALPIHAHAGQVPYRSCHKAAARLGAHGRWEGGHGGE